MRAKRHLTCIPRVLRANMMQCESSPSLRPEIKHVVCESWKQPNLIHIVLEIHHLRLI